MDIQILVTALRLFPAQQAGDLLTELSRTEWEEDAAKTLAYCLSGELQDWDELFEHEHIEEFFE